jgi:hypothetical protein
LSAKRIFAGGLKKFKKFANAFFDALLNIKTARTAFFTVEKYFLFRREQTHVPAAYIRITRSFTRCKLTKLPAFR